MKNLDSPTSLPSPATSDVDGTATSTRMPEPTHRPNFDSRLQKLFDQAVSKAEYDEIHEFLRLHSEKIDINVYDEQGQTPLQRFCMSGMLDLVKLLVRYGANTRLTNREGWSPVHIASFSGNSELLSYIVTCNSRNSSSTRRR